MPIINPTIMKNKNKTSSAAFNVTPTMHMPLELPVFWASPKIPSTRPMMEGASIPVPTSVKTVSEAVSGTANILTKRKTNPTANREMDQIPNPR